MAGAGGSLFRGSWVCACTAVRLKHVGALVSGVLNDCTGVCHEVSLSQRLLSHQLAQPVA